MNTWRVRACSCLFSHAHRAGPTGPDCRAGPAGGRGRTVRLPGPGARPARRPWPPLPVVRLGRRGRGECPGRCPLSPRSRNGSATSPRGPAGFSASPPTRSPAPCPSRTPTPCAVCSSNSTATPWTARSAPSSPPAPPRPAPDCGRSLLTARPCAAHAPTVTGHVTLLAAMDHTGHVLAQRQVADKSNEIPAFRPLLDSVDLTGTVITADALHTQHAHGTYSASAAPTTSPRSRPTIPVSSTASAACPGVRSCSTTTTAPGPTTAWRSGG